MADTSAWAAATAAALVSILFVLEVFAGEPDFATVRL
jgi:hypothetical protein